MARRSAGRTTPLCCGRLLRRQTHRGDCRRQLGLGALDHLKLSLLRRLLRGKLLRLARQLHHLLVQRAQPKLGGLDLLEPCLLACLRLRLRRLVLRRRRLLLLLPLCLGLALRHVLHLLLLRVLAHVALDERLRVQPKRAVQSHRHLRHRSQLVLLLLRRGRRSTRRVAAERILALALGRVARRAVASGQHSRRSPRAAVSLVVRSGLVVAVHGVVLLVRHRALRRRLGRRAVDRRRRGGRILERLEDRVARRRGPGSGLLLAVGRDGKALLQRVLADGDLQVAERLVVRPVVLQRILLRVVPRNRRSGSRRLGGRLAKLFVRHVGALRQLTIGKCERREHGSVRSRAGGRRRCFATNEDRLESREVVLGRRRRVRV